jgi:hypothetical protein
MKEEKSICDTCERPHGGTCGYNLSGSCMLSNNYKAYLKKNENEKGKGIKI